MQQFTIALPSQQVEVIAEAQKESGDTLQQWIDDRIKAAIKAQKTANLARNIRKNAKNAAILVKFSKETTLEEAVMQIGFTEDVVAFGGIGKLYKLIMQLGNDYFVPSDRIRKNVEIVPAAQVAAEKAGK